MRSRRRALALAGALLAGPALAQELPEKIEVPPPPVVGAYLPFPQLPSVALDEANNGLGIAQALCRERGAQARLLWIDGTANLERVSTAEKIAALVTQAKAAGFNTLVFDVKPIIGQTLYPSRYASKLTEWVRPWKTQTLPLAFDPLREMAAQAKAAGLGLLVSVNAFSEGHREFPGKGPGWEHPDWQSVLYEVELRLRREGRDEASFPVADRPNAPARRPDDLALYTDLARLPKLPAGSLAALVGADGVVIAQIDGAALAALAPKLPPGGAALTASAGAAVSFLRDNAAPGARFDLAARPVFVPISQRPERQVPLMTSPFHPDVRLRLLDILTELVSLYPIDGVVFDDRLRFAALNADFSEPAQRAFEAWLGKSVAWPDDVFRWSVAFPTLERGIVPGPAYDAWLTFRALTMRNFVAEAVRTVKMRRPEALVGTYVGSWYPDYPEVGANWAADDLPAGYRFLNDSYKKTGWASLVDFVITGCYYGTATLAEATEKGDPVGETVEAAGQFSNRAVNDQTFVYAGISLEKFKGKPDALKRTLQAACATTQGVMCFDLSHEIEPLWPLFAEAFRQPAPPPHAVPGLRAELKAKRAQKKASGVPDPPVILYRGARGTGF